MGIISRIALKNIFKTGNKPAQKDFADMVDSLMHKDDAITISKITGLTEKLEGGMTAADKETILTALETQETAWSELKDQTVLKYNDETLADDILKLADKTTGENVNYRKTNIWADGSAMDDTKVDGVFYIKNGNFYYVDVHMLSAQTLFVKRFGSNTEAINRAIDLAPPGFAVDGGGGSFNVSSVWLKSGIKFRNFNLTSIGTDQADVSVLCIGNDLNPNNYNVTHPLGNKYARRSFDTWLKNIEIENVVIDGNRAAHTNITTRDGGRQGICIKGRVSNIKIKSCEANYCATDGLQIYRGIAYAVPTDADFAANEISIENLSCKWNRRHGGSADSLQGLSVTNSTFNCNGRTIGSSEGEGGALFNGSTYANGFDIEGYGAGSRVFNLNFTNCKFLQNQKAGVLLYEQMGGGEAGFAIRDKIVFDSCEFDSGVDAGNLDAFIATPPIGLKTVGKYTYGTIMLLNCVTDGRYYARSVKNFIVKGGVQNFSKANEYYGLFDNAAGTVGSSGDIVIATGADFSIRLERTKSATLSFPARSIAAGEVVTLSGSLPGARPGDAMTASLSSQWTVSEKFVFVNAYAAYPQDKYIVTVQNAGTSAVDLEAGIIQVTLAK